MTDQAADIARGLTKAERQSVRDHRGWWQRNPLPDALCDKSGYMGREGWITTFRLNETGLAVRALLNAAGGGENGHG